MLLAHQRGIGTSTTILLPAGRFATGPSVHGGVAAGAGGPSEVPRPSQTWWANIDRNADQTVLYPKGPVAPGSVTDRYLSDYSNMHGDLSTGSGLNALTRDEGFTRDFLTRHRDKLLFGSDCNDRDAGGPNCLGAQIIAATRRLAAGRQIE